MNRIFVCENTENGHKVLLRLYGGKILEEVSILRSPGHEGEVLVFDAMARKRVGPQLLGVFSGGRLEEFILNADTLSPDDCKNEQLMMEFARKLAQLHSTKLPLSKTPKDYLGIIHDVLSANWSSFIQALKRSEIPDRNDMEEAAKLVYDYDIMHMVSWLTETLPKIKHKIVLVHGDVNLENCLVRQDVTDPDERLVLLDFEFTAYGYRGSDIGHHFKNRSLHIKRDVLFLPYPGEKDRLSFVRAYIAELKKQPVYDFEESMDNEYQILLEAEFFGAIADLFMAAWFIGEHKKLESSYLKFPVHPVLYTDRMIRYLDERKASVMELMQRGGL